MLIRLLLVCLLLSAPSLAVAQTERFVALSHRNLIKAGDEAMERGDFKAAANAFGEAVNRLKEHIRESESRGQQLDLTAIDASLRIAPFAYAHSLIFLRFYEKAAEAISYGLNFFPDWGKNHPALKYFADEGLVGQAINDLNAKLERDPNNEPLQFILGYVHFMRGDLETAKVIFEQTLTLNPENETTKHFLELLK